MPKLFARWCLPLLLLLSFSGYSQDERPPVTTAYFIDNAFIVQQPGTVIDLGGIIIRDGLIEAVGKGLTPPVDAKIMEGDSLYVYAGFIDGLSHVGVPKPKEGERPEVKDPGNPPRHVSGIQPERSVAAMLKADEKSIADFRKLGFTTAHVVPYGKMLPGKGAIVQLHGSSAEEMVLRENTSLFAQFEGTGRRVFPSTTMAIMAEWRELYAQAKQSQDHANRYQDSPRGMARPQHNEVLEAFLPVLDGNQPVFFAVDGIKEVHRAMGLAEELGFSLALADLGRAQLYLDRIKDRKTPLFLQLELPEAKDKKDDKDADTATAVLEEKRAEAMKEFEAQAAELAKAGVPFGFSSGSVKAKDIRDNIGRMIKAGLSEDQALAALTTSPAKLLGLSDLMGTVERGKIANLVVTDKPYFAEKSSVRYVFVDGMPTEYDVKKKKAKKPGDPDAKVNAVGTWTMVIDIPGDGNTGVILLEGSNDDLSGTITIQGEEQELINPSLEGNVLTFEAKFAAGGQNIAVSSEVTIEGDSFEGTIEASGMGSFGVEGERTSSPE